MINEAKTSSDYDYFIIFVAAHGMFMKLANNNEIPLGEWDQK